eukprot:TRINITY_DN6900_c0_g1_i1.p1 TRINITY_DN6900_c0_g1~~TRINITY_DN6900_c0_g1_i1.p1  ORF type:complete len:192 (+),score=46.27 TRINITY_DN6900_c0_g1_i1:62-637(+)
MCIRDRYMGVSQVEIQTIENHVDVQYRMNKDFQDKPNDVFSYNRNEQYFMLDDWVDEPDQPEEIFDEVSFITTSRVLLPEVEEKVEVNEIHTYVTTLQSASRIQEITQREDIDTHYVRQPQYQQYVVSQSENVRDVETHIQNLQSSRDLRIKLRNARSRFVGEISDDYSNDESANNSYICLLYTSPSPRDS